MSYDYSPCYASKHRILREIFRQVQANPSKQKHLMLTNRLQHNNLFTSLKAMLEHMINIIDFKTGTTKTCKKIKNIKYLLLENKKTIYSSYEYSPLPCFTHIQ